MNDSNDQDAGMPLDDMHGAHTHDAYGTLTPDATGGFNVYDHGQLVERITPNIFPGGLDVHHYGSASSANMADILDSFHFDPSGVHMPWDTPSHAPDAGPIIGTPSIDAHYWQPQTTDFTCAVQAQRGIIEEFTGEGVSEAQLVYEATSHGWLTDHGMSPSDVGDLLELHGIPCHANIGANVEDLIAELARGHKVIVGVDGPELWNEASPLNDFFRQSANHAIWVTGVDLSDVANPKVIINDSGESTGAGKAYDLAHFKDAWEDSGFFYVATNDAPSDMSFAASHGFDESAGIFPAITAYFEHLYSDFRDHLQDRLDDTARISPQETSALFTDASVRSFIENLPKSPMASLNESTMDTLFRII